MSNDTETLAQEMNRVAKAANEAREAPARAERQRIIDEAEANASAWVEDTAIPAIRAAAADGIRSLDWSLIPPRSTDLNLSEQRFCDAVARILRGHGFTVSLSFIRPSYQINYFSAPLSVSWILG